MKKLTVCFISALAFMAVSSVSRAQGGASPYLNSTHTYKVTMEDGINNTAQWVIADASGTPLATQPAVITDKSSNTATIFITWSDSWASADNDYKILFTETDGNSCASQRELVVDVIANTFYLTANEDASDCHGLSGEILGENDSGNTTLLFTVNLNKDASWSIETWQFDFTLTTTGNYTIQTVKLNAGPDLGGSGTYSDQSVEGSIAAAQIEVVVNGPVEEGTDVTIALSNGIAKKGSISTPDNGNGDKNQVLTVDPLPATSRISFE